MTTFNTDNTTYTVEPADDGTLQVSRTPRGEVDVAVSRGDLPTGMAQTFTAVAAVVYNPQQLDKDGVASRRRARFYTTDGDFVSTGWADDGALELEAADVARLLELDEQARQIVRERERRARPTTAR